MVSVCVAVYRAHPEPNVASLAAEMPAALDGCAGELVVALNGIGCLDAGVPEDARVVDLGINRGVAPGWNAAAGEARGDVLVFANDDVVLRPGALRVLDEALRAHPEAGVVGPVGARWDFEQGRHRATVDAEGLERGALRRCDAVSGFLFAVRRDVFAAVGGFDEAYAPASWEEIDFCAAVRGHGLGCFVCGGVDVVHEWGVSGRQPPWRTISWDGRRELLWSIHRRNRRRFLQKWGAR